MGLAQLRDQWSTEGWYKQSRTTPAQRLRWHFMYLFCEPLDALFSYRGRLLCRLLRQHGVTCRGRDDHAKNPYPQRWMRRLGW